MNRYTGLLLAASAMAFQAVAFVNPLQSEKPAPRFEIASVRRCPANPLITPAMSQSIGNNINGPSVIRVPSWIDSPLGKYYLYFAHHGGQFIRLAYADSPEGPWTVYEPGTLHLRQVPRMKGHIASPDVHVDQPRREIRMYFHGLTANGQQTGVAISKDGLRFEPLNAIVGNFYFRVFQRDGFYYAIAKDGNSGWGELLRSKDGLSAFERRGNFLSRMRHAAVWIRGDRMVVFYSRVGDAPERILAASVDLTGDWTNWIDSEPVDVLRPQEDYEGIRFANIPSDYGAAVGVRQLRDPYVFEEAGKTWLFYSIAGEMGIAMAEITVQLNTDP